MVMLQNRNLYILIAFAEIINKSFVIFQTIPEKVFYIHTLLSVRLLNNKCWLKTIVYIVLSVYLLYSLKLNQNSPEI